MTTALQPYADRYRAHLLDNILPFWMTHSLDREHGGFFTGLDREGKLYDSRKYVWMNGRAVWTFARLFRTLAPREEYREFSLSCLEFLRKNAYAPDGTIYFSLTREGSPAFQQRKPYSAVFVALGLIEAARAFGNEQYLQEGIALFWKVRRWVDHLEELGRPASTMSQLADIMVIALLALELSEVSDDPRYPEELAWCLRQVWLHLDSERGILRENALVDRDTPEGRFFCAGSAAEVGWFLLHVLEKFPDAKTEAMLLDAIDQSLHFGWDNEYGGLYYFQDVEDRPMLQLESNMKLWWPHTEAIYAAILAYTKTQDAKWLRWLEKLDKYTFETFPDPQGKEWFGYCDRRNVPTSMLKGNNYKGVFHVPRFLLFSMQRIGGATVTI
ncbi:N-acylglucosamine 2-epimerase [Bryobacterales bacterium F-183]|nr:N-acylglucosamine 2-epimerase [Bryobacterales bacterium F-183]